MEEGLTSTAGTLEAWPLELSLGTVILGENLALSEDAAVEAAEKAAAWSTLGAAGPLRAIEETANAAPMILPLSQSVLHIWSAIETLFPDVRMELKFRIALYVAQLTATGPARLEVYDRVRASYDLRSSITHGSHKEVSMDQWQQTWGVLIAAYNAVIQRGSLPAEKDLIAELLS